MTNEPTEQTSRLTLAERDRPAITLAMIEAGERALLESSYGNSLLDITPRQAARAVLEAAVRAVSA